MALKIYRRENSKLNHYLSYFFFCQASFMFTNLIYASLFQATLVKFLHILTWFIGLFGYIFLLLFNLILLYSQKKITPKIQNSLILGNLILMSVFFLLSDSVIIDETTDWRPVWDLPYVLYSLISFNLVIIPVVISSLKLYKIFNLQNLKARWAAYMLGILIWMFIMNITPFINQLYDPTLAMFYFIVSLSIIPANLLIYLGVGKIDKA
ncbi:MAG: hypothetical protein EU544_01655 [Promethearchaeota archaeon]|nr:MAG: hypothetical protein EU544_01655 [Candidatus Lokiarchaeota archaeon]